MATGQLQLVCLYIFNPLIVQRECVMWFRWSETPVEQRTALLLRVADLLEVKLDEFAEAESRDQGKPVWLARSLDIPRAVYNFRCFATAMPHRADKCVIVVLAHTDTSI